MSLGYTVRESLSGFRRTKLSSAISIATVAISLLLLGIFAVVSINTTGSSKRCATAWRWKRSCANR